MANEHLFVPKLAAATIGGAQGDPNASLGGLRSSTTIADVVSTITGFNSDREIIDTTQISAPDRTGAWIVFLDTHLNEAREVIAFDDSTGAMTLEEALPGAPVVTDRYWLFMPNGLFSSFDGADCRSRDPRHRLVYAHNESGGQQLDVRLYVKAIEAGPVECRVAIGTVTFTQAADFDVDDLADENEVPPLDRGSGFAKITSAEGSPQDFARPIDYAGAEATTPTATIGVSGEASINDTRERPIFVQLAFPDGAAIPRAQRVVFQVFIDVDDGTTISSFIVVADVDGVAETIVPVVDRRLRLAAGARLSCLIQDSVSLEAVPGATIDIVIGSGPGSMNDQVGRVQEGATPIRRIYVSPTDPGDVGASVRFDFEVT